MPAEGVLHETDRHTDGGGAEAPVEADRRLQQTRDERAEEGAEVDAEVEEREPRIASHIARRIQRADDRGGVRLQPAGADGDQDQADRETGVFGAVTKSDIRAAVNAIDDYLVSNAAAINTAIPQPARGQLTTSQKALLLTYVIRRRYLSGA